MKQYTAIIKDAWRTTRRTPLLWWFGLFGLVVGGRGIEIETVFTNGDIFTSRLSPLQADFWQVDQWGNSLAAAIDKQPSLALIVPILAVLAVVLAALVVMSQIGLVDGFEKNTKRRLRPRYSLDEAVAASKNHFWKVLGVNVFGKGISVMLLIAAAGPLFVANVSSMRVAVSLVLYVFAAVVTVVLSVLVKFAVNAIVLDNQDMHTALTTAWQMIKRNPGAVLEMALLMFGLYLGLNLVLLLLAIGVALPLGFIGCIIYLSSGYLFGLHIFVLVAYVLYVLFLIAGMMLFSTVHYGSWTLLYLKLKENPLISKVKRLFHRK